MSYIDLPKEKLLVAYWLHCELPSSGGFACPPLREIADYKLKDDNPQINVVTLFSGTFNGTSDKFEPPYIAWDSSIEKVLTNGDVHYLQSQGIKVILSVVGNNSLPNGIGWSCIPEEKNDAFAQWVKSEIIDKYNLDGIDIDDEFSNCTEKSPQKLVKTVKALREVLPNQIISKALWQDEQYFEETGLAELLTFGCTMGYGWSIEHFKQKVNRYKELGLSYNKICFGVQAGPSDQDWMTYLQTTKELTEWAVQNNLLGMMLYSFSQDIQQFTSSPQKLKPYPSPDDHEWQKQIVNTMWGIDNWVVKPIEIMI